VLPVFGKGDTRFQPVYVGDIGLLVEVLTRNRSVKVADGKVIEAAGPDGKIAQL
jgi:NADH dehydrogenase